MEEKTMKKIIVLAVVAILVFAAAGLTLSPAYVLIERQFVNAGGSSEYEANTSITDFGHADIYNKATSFCPDSSIALYNKVELGDPDDACLQGPCVELEKVVQVEWNKSAVTGNEDTLVYGWMDEDSAWSTDPSVPSTGFMVEQVKINKIDISGPPCPPSPPCWSGHCP
jgi:hypothetical protein